MVFCSVRSAASVRQIDCAPISCVYQGSRHNSRWDAVQPAGAAETVTADICAAGRRKSRHTAQIAQIDGMKIARIAPGLFYLHFPASDDRIEKIRISGNSMLIVAPPFNRSMRRAPCRTLRRSRPDILSCCYMCIYSIYDR